MKIDKYTKVILTVIAVMLVLNFLNIKVDVQSGKIKEAGILTVSGNSDSKADAPMQVVITGVDMKNTGNAMPVLPVAYTGGQFQWVGSDNPMPVKTAATAPTPTK